MPEKYKITFTGEISFEKVTEDNPPVVNPPVVDPPVINPPVVDPHKVTNEFYGINCFPWTPVGLINPCGSARVYCGSHWIWQPDGLFIQPMYQAETEVAHGIDDMLINMQKAGVDPLLCIHQTPEWFNPTGNPDGTNANDFPPYEDFSTKAEGYIDYAKMLFQVAARYGSIKWPNDQLKVSTITRWNNDVPQVKKSGLNLLKYIEPWNEPDKWWKRIAGKQTEYFEPEQAAAFMSACYDGHEGSLQLAGIKKADPNMKVVMPGITGPDMTYLLAMDKWFKTNRKDKKWPCDIANIHWYNNMGNVDKKWPPTWFEGGAISPYEDKSLPMFTEVMKFFKALGLPVWVTEFGCDSEKPSIMSVANGEVDQSEVILKTYKFYKEQGVERAFAFMVADESNAPGLWQRCGFYKSKEKGYKPKQIALALKVLLKK